MTTGPVPIGPEANTLGLSLQTRGQLGSTTDGAQWCLKALHPAEPSIERVGIPDGSAGDSVKMQFTWANTVAAPAGAVGSWGFDGTLIPHPLCAFEGTYDNAARTEFNLHNPQFTKPVGTYSAYHSETLNWINQFERWRICGCSVTIHLDANATKDSGTFVAAQQAVQPSLIFPGSSPTGLTHGPALFFHAADLPDYKALMQMPKSYQNNAKFGLYMPLKLTNTSQHWRSTKELTSVVSITDSWSNFGIWQIPSSTKPAYPFWDATPLIWDSGLQVAKGDVFPGLCNDIFGHICCRGLDLGAQLVFKFKLCFECQVQASSALAPHQSPGLALDEMALKMYPLIAREMPDAFDATANDDGKVLRWIGRGLKKAAPYFQLIPRFGSTLSTVATTLGGAATYGGKAIKNRNRKQKKMMKKKIIKKQAKKQKAGKKGGASTTFVTAEGKEIQI